MVMILELFSFHRTGLSFINLKKAVESTTSGYCTDSLRDFDDFLLHRMGDTSSAKNRQNLSKNQHINHSRYDSTAFFRIIIKKRALSIFLVLLSGLLSAPLHAVQHKKNADDTKQTEAKDKDNERYPIGCRPVGYKESLKIISLFPGKESALQSMYFF